MDPLELVKLPALMARTSGSPSVKIGLIDGPVATGHPDLVSEHLLHGELLKLGIEVCQATVAKYMTRQRRPPSQTWRTFLRNHIGQIVEADFFVVPTAT